MLYLQLLRDEAYRFAIASHRKKRNVYSFVIKKKYLALEIKEEKRHILILFR